MPTERNINRETDAGVVIVSLSEEGHYLRANCYIPPRGPAIFTVFPAGAKEDEVVDAVVAVALLDGIEPESNITHLVPGALVAGTLSSPTFRMERRNDE